MNPFGFTEKKTPSPEVKKEVTAEKEKFLVRGISFPPELWAELKKVADHRHISYSALIRMAVVEYFDKLK